MCHLYPYNNVKLLRKFFYINLTSNRQCQCGFVKGRSTSLQLLQILDKWIDCLENGAKIDAVYTDFEKAFDKVN